MWWENQQWAAFVLINKNKERKNCIFVKEFDFTESFATNISLLFNSWLGWSEFFWLILLKETLWLGDWQLVSLSQHTD